MLSRPRSAICATSPYARWRTLAAADAVLAEDTRVSRNLLAHYGIATPLIAYHEHNAAAMRPILLAPAAEGRKLALISDAGTPLVSDPGFKLVAEAVAREYAGDLGARPLGGAGGAGGRGLADRPFLFRRFSAAEKRRPARRGSPNSPPFRARWCMFELPRRLAETLVDLAAVLGPRQAAVARELTKHFESVRRGALDALAADYERDGPPKGEIVLLVAPPGRGRAGARRAPRSTTYSRRLAEIFAQGRSQRRRPPRPASRAAKVYARALELSAGGKTG